MDEENIAFRKPARASSNVHYWGRATHVTDGSKVCEWGHHGVTHSAYERNPWIRIDVGFGEADPMAMAFDKIRVW